MRILWYIIYVILAILFNDLIYCLEYPKEILKTCYNDLGVVSHTHIACYRAFIGALVVLWSYNSLYKFDSQMRVSSCLRIAKLAFEAFSLILGDLLEQVLLKLARFKPLIVELTKYIRINRGRTVSTNFMYTIKSLYYELFPTSFWPISIRRRNDESQ